MRILEIRELTVPIASPMRNAVIDFSEMTVSLVAVVSDEAVDGEPVVGFGFNSNGRYGQAGLLRERVVPRILGADPAVLLDASGTMFDPHAVRAVAMHNEKPGAHGDRAVAVGIVDMAMWDLVAKLERRPLCAALSERFGNGSSAASVPVYAAGGYYAPDKDLELLCGEIRGYLDLGYDRVKIKVGGAPIEHDRARIAAVIAELPSDGGLAVDANGRFELDEALAYAAMLAEFDLVWFEEPCDPLDFETLTAVAMHYPGVLATGENLHSVRDVVNLARYGGLRPESDVIQVDPALSYGLSEYLAVLARLGEAGFAPERFNPHGGHQFNLHIAAALGLGGVESYPGVFEPFGGFADAVPVRAGRVAVPEAPGIGLELKSALVPLLDELARAEVSPAR